MKKMIIFIGMVAALIGVASLSGIEKQFGKALVKPINPTPQEAELKMIGELEKAAKVLSKNTPKMVDEYTRMDAATIGPGFRVNINYTLPKHSAGEIDADQIVLNMRPGIKNYACSKKNMKLLLQFGADFAYLYHDKDGMLFTSITIDRNDCGLSKIALYDDDFTDGFDAYQKQDYKTAHKLWLPLAEQGDAPAQYNLGVMYEKGQGVPQDYKEAVRLYRLSAEQGYAKGQSNLGVMYYNGQGVPQDYVSAHMWWSICGSSGKKKCAELINIVKKKMTPSQIEKAQEMARNWKPKK